jgi:hypothetical protein
MFATFELNHEKLGAEPRFAELAGELSALSPIDSPGTFNRYCREACRLWNEQLAGEAAETSANFAGLLERLDQGGDDVIATGWGGVVIAVHEHPRVQKYLVVRQGGYLALEMHEQKDERLDVKEGAGLVLWRAAADPGLIVEALAPGSRFHFHPGIEHCLIGTENLLVLERSIDPKGMDQDLIFIYQPALEAANAR